MRQHIISELDLHAQYILNDAKDAQHFTHAELEQVAQHYHGWRPHATAIRRCIAIANIMAPLLK